ncbi:uncharacterized protein LOC144702342 [Wolffia australiana]
MMKQSSSRVHRNRGWKVKHVLQICILATVCVWLIYQVRHSYDRKKSSEELISKPSDAVEENRTGTLKLGRKDPQQKSEVLLTDGEEQEEAEGIEEQDDDKIDENEDMIDEIDHESEGIDREDIDEKSQEAREVNYKADDASSAVEPQKNGDDLSKEQLTDESSPDPSVSAISPGPVTDHKNNTSTSDQSSSNSTITPVSKEQLTNGSSPETTVEAVSPGLVTDHYNSTSTSAQSSSNSTITSQSGNSTKSDLGVPLELEQDNKIEPVSSGILITKEVQSPGKVSSEKAQSPEIDQNKATQVNNVTTISSLPDTHLNTTKPGEKGLAAE